MTTSDSEIDQYSYAGTAGQIVSFALQGFQDCYAYAVEAGIYDPNGKLLTTLNACGPQATNLTLALSGTFTVLVHDSSYAHTGNYELSTQSVIGGGCEGTAVSCGQTVTGVVTVDTQMNAYAYAGTAGQIVSFALQGFQDCYAYAVVADIYEPNGKLLTRIGACGPQATNLTLALSGIFTVLVHDSSYGHTGNYELSTQSVIGGGCEGTAVSCGQTVTGVVTVDTQMNAYAYAGTAGQIVSFALQGFQDCYAYAVEADIYDPNGKLLTTLNACAPQATNLTLALSGTFTVLVHDSSYAHTGNYELSTQSVTGGGCGGFTIPCGQTVNDQTSFPTQMDAYELVANAGEHVILSDSGFSGMVVNIYDPTGSNVVSLGTSTSTNYVFADTGIYTVAVHSGAYNDSGSYGLTLTVLGGCAALPTVSVTPAGAVVQVGSAATFTAIGSGPTPLEYQWRFGSNEIYGATNNTLTIADVQTNNAGSYAVVVSNPGGAVTNSPVSLLAVLDWTNPPAIIYGTALSSSQLNATATIPGTFAYSPPVGTVLNSGTNVLSVVFSPTDTAHYSSVTDAVSLVVSNAALTITANSQSKIYGQTFSFAGTEFVTSGLVNGDSVTSASLASPASPPTVPVSGSPYPISITNATGDAGLTNYIITYVNGLLTVNPAALSVAASPQSKIYGQNLAFSSGITLFSSTNLQNGESIGTVTLAVSGNGGAPTAPTNAYILTPSAATAGTFNPNNYSITYYTGTLMVNPAALSVTADVQSKTYGQTLAFGSGSTLFTSTNLQNGETIGAVTLTVSGNGGAQTAPANLYSITPSAATGGAFNANNYIITYYPGTLTVNPAPLTITVGLLTKTYGQTIPSEYCEVNATGLVNGDPAPCVTLTSPGLAPTALTNTYVLAPSAATGGTFNPNNYAITYSLVTLTVNPAALSVTASPQTKAFGATLLFGSGSTNFTSTNLQNGDTIGSVTLAVSGNGGAPTAPTNNYIITPSAATGGTFNPNNYTITYYTGILDVITPVAVITWTNPAPIIYGEALTTNQLDATANVPGTFAYTPTNGSVLNAGTNVLSVVFTPTDTADYSNATDTVSLVVSNAPLTVTATNQIKTYGETINFSGIEFTTTGLTNRDTVSSASLSSLGAPSAAPASGSPYTIFIANAVGNPGLTNYNISYINGTLTVNPLAVSLTGTRSYNGTTSAASTILTVGNIVGGDVVSVVSGSATLAGGNVGTEAITLFGTLALGGGSAVNYTLTGASGSVTIIAAPLTVTADAQSKTYGQTLVFGSGSTLFTSSNLQNAETIDTVTLAVSGNGGAPTTPTNTYAITPSAATGGTFNPANYSITYDNGTLTVNPLAVSLTGTRSYNGTTSAASTILTVGNIVGGDVVSVVSGSGALASANVGTEAMTSFGTLALGGGSAGNYTLKGASGSVIITAAPLTVTADSQSKAYGQTLVFGNGSTNFTSGGLQNGETIGTVTLAVSNNGGAATAPIGSYSIIPSAATNGTFAPGNYAINYQDGTLTVALPLLQFTSQNDLMVLSWTTNVAGLSLQMTTNLSSPSNWVPVSGSIVIGDQNEFITSMSGAAVFVRLKLSF